MSAPSHVADLDQGEAIVVGEEDGKWIKLKLKGKKLTGSSSWRSRKGQGCGRSRKMKSVEDQREKIAEACMP